MLVKFGSLVEPMFVEAEDGSVWLIVAASRRDPSGVACYQCVDQLSIKPLHEAGAHI